MIVAVKAASVRARPARRKTSSMIRCSRGTTQFLSPGQVLTKLNRESPSNNEHLITVKRSLDQAVFGTFHGQATVKHQGLKTVGTELQAGVPDWDFEVRVKYQNTGADPFPRQCHDFLEAARSSMLQQGTRTKYETGDLMSAAREGCNHVTLSIWQDRQRIGEFDVSFDSYITKYPRTILSDTRKLADSQEARQVVRYIKKLSMICCISEGQVQAGGSGQARPEQPKSMYLEDLVLSEEEKLLDEYGLQEAVPHFEGLLRRTLRVIATQSGAYSRLLRKAQLASTTWATVARAVLNALGSMPQEGLPWEDGYVE